MNMVLARFCKMAAFTAGIRRDFLAVHLSKNTLTVVDEVVVVENINPVNPRANFASIFRLESSVSKG